MSRSIKAIVYHAHGKPEEVLRLEEQLLPLPAADEALVLVAAAPINPADLNAIEGKYPIRPDLPATPGMEGAGVVVKIGSAVKNLPIGTQVILPHNLGTWREACVVSAEKLVAVPNEIEPEQAAMLKINPLTAWRMLHDFVALQPGDWMIQNAANSAAGRAAIVICRELGFRTVNVVRRPELIDELRAEGGDVVLLDHETARRSARSYRGRGTAVGAKRGRRRERAPSRQLPRTRRHHGDLRGDEPATAADSERTPYFQESAFHRFLGEQVV
jgi:trans-2-enoyl-CoA reductase